MNNPKILITEDEVISAHYLKEMLENNGFHVLPIARSAEKSIKIALDNRPDVIIMDIRLQGERDGIDAVCEIINKFNVPIIFTTGNPLFLDDDRLKMVSNYTVLPKPPLDNILLETINKMLKS